MGVYYRGENVVASSGTTSSCIPGEVHTGQPAVAEGWTYRMFYFDPRFLKKITAEVAGKPRGLPFFQSGVIEDDLLAQDLRALHVQLETAATPKLEQESSLLNVLAALIKRYADDSPLMFRIGQEAQAVTQVRDYLEHHYAEDVSLADLANETLLGGRSLLEPEGKLSCDSF